MKPNSNSSAKSSHYDRTFEMKQKPAVIARFSAFSAYVFAARRTVGQEASKTMSSNTRVLILGGGFGGLYAALEFEKRKDPDFDVTLVSHDNFFLFTPMLLAGMSSCRAD